MPKEAPFDVWDGEELGLSDEVEEAAPEEVAMHVDPESEPDAEGGPRWSDLTDGDDGPDVEAPVCYFPDEHPEIAGDGAGPTGQAQADGADEEREPDLEELLERQHYAFPE
jgi:hypothetical protein